MSIDENMGELAPVVREQTSPPPRDPMPATPPPMPTADPRLAAGVPHSRPRLRRHDPMVPYQRRLALVDLSCVAVAVCGTWVIRFTPDEVTPGWAEVGLGALVVGVWLAVIALRGGYDRRILGAGTEEFKRVINATVAVFAVIAGLSYLFRADVSRAFVLGSLPFGLLLILIGRWRARVWLVGRRARGDMLLRTLVVGLPDEAGALADTLDTDVADGFLVVATCEPPTEDVTGLDGWVVGVLQRIDENRIDAVAIAQSARMSPEAVRQLAWGLEGPRVDLLVEPAFSDIAGPRVSVRPAAGVPLLHLDEPHLNGPKRFLKRAFDLSVAVLALIVLLPVLLVIALLIAVSSRGPLLFRQDRVGQRGERFSFLKFRTMVVGADAMRAEVIGDPDGSIAERYRNDPRVTPVGRMLRRWSLDELPQLLNVAAGSMSLVGPRPMLPDEMALLGASDHRRHLTKPGLTGLWQISGRKEVAWEERMRLDLHYVEHWSIALDLIIIAKTTKAVAVGRGAY